LRLKLSNRGIPGGGRKGRKILKRVKDLDGGLVHIGRRSESDIEKKERHTKEKKREKSFSIGRKKKRPHAVH